MRQITVPLNKLPGMFLRYGSEADRGSYSSLQRVVNRVKHIVSIETLNAKPASPNGSVGAVDTGKYQRSWKVSRATISGIRGVLITNSAEYMAVIERGRGIGKRAPPRDVIARWAQRKLGLPFKEAQRAAWPIARAISRRGLYARRVMTGDAPMAAYKDAMREFVGQAVEAASIRVFR